MTPEVIKKRQERFDALVVAAPTLMSRGITIGGRDKGVAISDGWMQALVSVVEALEALIELVPEETHDLRLEQIKNKWGCLTIYVTPSKNERVNWVTDLILSGARLSSMFQCAWCGDPKRKSERAGACHCDHCMTTKGKMKNPLPLRYRADRLPKE